MDGYAEEIDINRKDCPHPEDHVEALNILCTTCYGRWWMRERIAETKTDSRQSGGVR